MNDQSRSAAGDNATRRAIKACLSCRKLKTRCIVSDGSIACQRCVHSQRTCTWPDDGQNVVKKRGPSRIKQLEAKIDSLMTQVKADEGQEKSSSSKEPRNDAGFSLNGSKRDSETHSSPHSSLTSTSSPNSSQILDLADSIRQLEITHDFSSPASYSHRKSDHQTVEDDTEDIHWTKLVDDEQAQRLLSRYRPMSASFPFVKLAQVVTAKDLRSEKPMLLLAILAVSSWRQRSLQNALGKQYRRELAARTIVASNKSIDLIQSLAVYLAWYHHFFSHKSNNIYSLLQLMAGLVHSLDLYEKSKPNSWYPENHCLGLMREQRENQRTLLGCYFLSSSFSAMLKKPNPVHFSSYMSECLDQLAKAEDFPSDRKLAPLIDSCALHDKIADLTRLREPDQPLPDFQNLSSQLSAQYEIMQFSQVASLLHLATVVDLYSLVFRDDYSVLLSKIKCQDYMTMAQSCLNAAKAFLDSLLKCSPTDYHLLPFTVWSDLAPIILLLSGINAGPTRKLTHISSDFAIGLNLDLYLESLCHRMQQITTYDPPSQPHLDFWISMKIVMNTMLATSAKQNQSGLSDIPSTLPQSHSHTHTTQRDQNVNHIQQNIPNHVSVPDISNISTSKLQATADVPTSDLDLEELLYMDFGGPKSDPV